MKQTLISYFFLHHVLYWFSSAALFLLRWEIKGKIPDFKKFVLIGAPHSSNWDFVLFILAVFKLRISVHWMGKHTLFRWPFRYLLKKIGGIPVNRTTKSNAVQTMVKAFDRSERMILTIAPSGTRSKTEKWKSGFYHIACQADVPIVFGFIDNLKKHIGIGPAFRPGGRYETDIKAIKSYYRKFSGRYSIEENTSVI